MNLLLLPGFMNDDRLWDGVKGQLETVGEIFFGDLSHGRDIAEMACQVLEDAPARFTAVGFSMGGYVAREIARVAPHRVERLVLIATSARADGLRQTKRKAAAVEQVRRSGFQGLSRRSIIDSLARQRSDERDLVDMILAMGQRLGEATFLRQAEQRRESDFGQLNMIGCPTLIVGSLDDPLRGIDETKELHAGIPGSELVFLKGPGHMIPLEAPKELASLLVSWLKKNWAQDRLMWVEM